MKPAWFYDIIGAVSTHDIKLALKAWDAELLDYVTVDLTIKTEHIDIYDPGFDSRITTVPGYTEATAIIKDVSTPPKFNPIKMMIRPETVNTYMQDMNPDEGQWRPFFLFECMYIDRGAIAWDYNGRWEPENKWYFIQPYGMTINNKPNRKKMDLW